ADSAAHRIGEEAMVMVTSTLQTSAGRLIFTRLHDEDTLEPPDTEDRGAPDQSGSGGAGAESAVEGGGAPPESPATPASPATPGAEPGPAESGAGRPGAEPPKRSGPFPPKPPSRRPNSARNPRR